MQKAKKTKLLEQFEKLYPNPKTELVFKGPYQLAISVMLSAQCTDKKVNQVTPELFERYPSFEELSKARVTSVEKIIRAVNYYRTKAKHVVATAKLVTEEHGGKLPRVHKQLTTLPGIGQKTANVIMSELGIEPAFPVDTHVFRVSKRLGLATAETREKVEEELKQEFEPLVWRPLHHWLILHGRRVCKARTPLCAECTLNSLCPSNSCLD